MLATIIIRRGDMLFPLAELPLRSGVAAARAIDDVSGLTVTVKWPNDLVFDGRKLGGLLCEARRDVAFVGIGVNCLQTGFPGGLGLPACSIRQASGRVVAPRDLLRAVLFRLREAMDDSGWLRFLVDRLEGRGRVVRVDVPGSDQSYSGVLEAVDEKGCLVLRTATGEELHIPQGEITSAR
jgi:BirA family biotin operon repressor/biotin-[acetyl-CoA-carboxylase] ligase